MKEQNQHQEPDQVHYEVCPACRHMYILRELIMDFCDTPSELAEIRDFCQFLIDGEFCNE